MFLSACRSFCFSLPRGSVGNLFKKRAFCTVLGTNAFQKSKETLPVNSDEVNTSKYAELNSRLAAIPYENLLNVGIEAVKRDFAFDKSNALTDVMNWTSKVFDYNVKNGKKIRGKALLKAFCTYSFDSGNSSWNAFDSDGWKKAVALAWCVEMLQAYFIVLDDIMDQSILRRGQPCWYKLPDVGLCAINDSLILEHGIFKLLQKNFEKTDCYSQLLQEFLEVMRMTVDGQCLDMLCNPPNLRPNFECFNFERYITLVEFKTSHYTYRLPVYLAMHLVGGYSKEAYDCAKELCLKIGLYFQSRDDYLDCFGNPEVTGKHGNDVREGKCTWFAVKFLEEASDVQRKQFMENYGRDDQNSLSIIMDLYKNSALLEKFEHFEENVTREISSLIESMGDIKGGLYYDLFSEIRKREK